MTTWRTRKIFFEQDTMKEIFSKKMKTNYVSRFINDEKAVGCGKKYTAVLSIGILNLKLLLSQDCVFFP